jgi:exosortase/archaeosortase family protein
VIELSDSMQLNVETACSGLRMMMLSFALCVGAAFVVRKPLWEKLVLIASAIPIAIIANVSRIVMVALLCHFSPTCPDWLVALLGVTHPQQAYDKLVGVFLMMPIGLLLLWAEMTLLSKLLLAPLPERPLMMGKMSNKS